jgi:prepilin-type processing-associated H-X9-DG protein
VTYEDGGSARPHLLLITAARSKHPGGVNVGFIDGSVRFVKNTVNPDVDCTLSTTNAGEVLSADAY